MFRSCGVCVEKIQKLDKKRKSTLFSSINTNIHKRRNASIPSPWKTSTFSYIPFLTFKCAARTSKDDEIEEWILASVVRYHDREKTYSID